MIDDAGFVECMKIAQKRIHQNAIDKGWWEVFENGKAKSRNPLEVYALVHSEISEAVEEARKGTPSIYAESIVSSKKPFLLPTDSGWSDEHKLEGELIELADAVIRIMDYCESRDWDLGEAILLKHRYNKTRPYRHGGKKY